MPTQQIFSGRLSNRCCRHARSVLLVATFAMSTATSALARTHPVPDAGSLLRHTTQAAFDTPVLTRPETPRALIDTGLAIRVQRFDIEGSTRFEPEQLEAQLADLIGRNLAYADLRAAAERVALFYERTGAQAAAVLPDQDFEEGVVKIIVIEARFGRIRFDVSRGADKARFPMTLIRRMVASGQSRGRMIDAQALERATLLANDLPGVRVTSVLSPGAVSGDTDIVVKIESRPKFIGSASLGNTDVRASGAGRAGGHAAWSSLREPGDEVSLASRISEGKQYLKGAYQAPIGSSGTSWFLDASAMQYKLVRSADSSGAAISGKASTFGAGMRHPIMRSIDKNLYAAASLQRRQFANDYAPGTLQAGPPRNSVTAITLALSGETLDRPPSVRAGNEVGAGPDTGPDAGFAAGSRSGSSGGNIAAIAFTAGVVNLEGNPAPAIADQTAPRTDGRYSKFTGRFGRLQKVSRDGSVWLSASGQASSHHLDRPNSSHSAAPMACAPIRRSPPAATAELLRQPSTGIGSTMTWR